MVAWYPMDFILHISCYVKLDEIKKVTVALKIVTATLIEGILLKAWLEWDDETMRVIIHLLKLLPL